MTSNSVWHQILGWGGWFAVTFIAAAVGSAASIEAADFYGQLVQPVWSPPAWLFGPVWTTLFTMMAVAAALVWRAGGFREHRQALGLFVAQLVLNALWSWLFFAWHLGGIAFVEVVLLWLAILATLILFWRARRLAGLLLVPYLLWVTFAAVLNFTLWQLNPDLL